MGLTFDGLYNNLKITDVNVQTETLYAEGEVVGIEWMVIYKYMIGSELTGEMEVPTGYVDEAKEYIVRKLLKDIDRLGMGE